MSRIVTRDTQIGPNPLPAVDDDMRAAAKQSPSQWMMFYDPGVDLETPGLDVNEHPYIIQGARWVDESGTPTEDVVVNADYWPSPSYVGFEFSNGLELGMWQVFRGYRVLGTLVDALYHNNVITRTFGEHDTAVHVGTVPDTGQVVIQIATSEQFVPAEWEHTHTIEGSELLVTMAETPAMLDINPGSDFRAQFPIAELTALVTIDTIDPFRQHRPDSVDEEDSTEQPNGR